MVSAKSRPATKTYSFDPEIDFSVCYFPLSFKSVKELINFCYKSSGHSGTVKLTRLNVMSKKRLKEMIDWTRSINNAKPKILI